MKIIPDLFFNKYLLLVCLILGYNGIVFAQATLPNGSGANAAAKDTSKTNTSKWKDEDAKITYERLNSARVYTIDSSLHTFQRQPSCGDWGRDLGNLGSPVNNLFFTPEDRVGPTLGYHVSDAYRFNVDSMDFYTTSKPFSIFSYELGSKLEQTASLMHTQNVKPNWNFAFEYRKINSPGFYQVERNNHDDAYLSTNYKSLDKHYTIYAAMVYNRIQHDENGGIVDSEFYQSEYTDRQTMDAAYENGAYSTTRSSVYNIQRDFTFLFQHSYSWGRTDTTYNTDSTEYHYKLIPRFSLTHKLEISSEKHLYNDYAPDSLRYLTLFNYSFVNSGPGYYSSGQDSVYMQQNWVWIDNKIMMNGFIGNAASPLEFSAGLGNRYDEFITQPVPVLIHDSLPAKDYTQGLNRDIIISNYLEGQIKKEALRPGEWEYGADVKYFLTGDDAGNFMANAALGKGLKNGLGSFVVGVKQTLNSTPYNYTIYENMYATDTFHDSKPENVNMLYATIESPKLRLSAGVNNYLIGNYVYINQNEIPFQDNNAFTVQQAWIRKVFKVGNIYLDNQLAYQQMPAGAPVNVPAFMGRHQLSYERNMFKKKLKIEAGIEVRYNTAYHPAGYDALLNRFFYQNNTYVSNAPEASVFLNFRVKRFRAFVMCDNLQQLFFQNTVLFVGTPVVNIDNIGNYTPVYAAPDLLIRFGFSWPLVN